MEHTNLNGSGIQENIDPGNVNVDVDGAERVATGENGKKFKVIFCVIQNLTSLSQRPYFLE
jgi:hypothetical protein